MAKTLWSAGHSECNKVELFSPLFSTTRIWVPLITEHLEDCPKVIIKTIHSVHSSAWFCIWNILKRAIKHTLSFYMDMSYRLGYLSSLYWRAFRAFMIVFMLNPERIAPPPPQNMPTWSIWIDPYTKMDEFI